MTKENDYKLLYFKMRVMQMIFQAVCDTEIMFEVGQSETQEKVVSCISQWSSSKFLAYKSSELWIMAWTPP